MINRLDELLNFHQQALNLRGLRQQVLASNIANADTPGYKARDIDFAAALKTALAQPAAGAGGAAAAPAVLYRTVVQPSVDGNTVDMDVERAHFAENAVHYEASLTFLNSQIKTMLAAIQG